MKTVDIDMAKEYSLQEVALIGQSLGINAISDYRLLYKRKQQKGVNLYVQFRKVPWSFQKRYYVEGRDLQEYINNTQTQHANQEDRSPEEV